MILFTQIAGLSVHVPGANLTTVDLVKSVLGEMQITAEIDLGWCGTGIGSDKNKYTDRRTGKPMSHRQVISRIRSYTKDLAI